ncbi:glycosyltransferase family 2 protein [Priestia aryabhattai]|uniref:glycosyltransferase family 2 protein n=1 Tax=Priestia aryabhattai TaxID=412384 RepID=UPI001CCDF857|nr:glycosyltransferase [Priestia aryabhattai]MBZ6489059.1 glycosyltransferase [Priestia aryabhattai]
MEENGSLISVIIPTFNRKDAVIRAIKSVLNQTYKNIEVLVIDDASTDGTKGVIKDISDGRVKYFELENNTKGTMPRNFGIEKSTGEYIAFLDSDDEWLPNKLELQLDYIKSHEIESSPVLCFTNANILINKKKTIEVKNKECYFEDDIVNYIFEKNNFVQTSTFMIKADIAKKVQFDPKLTKHQDYDFCIRLQNKGVKFLLLEKNLTLYYSDTNSNQISSFSVEKIKTSMNWFNENEKYFNENSKRMFIIQNYLYFYILDNKKKLALKIVFEAYKEKIIDLKKVIKVFLSMLIPKKKLKKMLR